MFGGVKVYDDRETFEVDEARHMVKKDSGYAWKESNERVYGWVVKETGSFGEGGLAKADAGFVLVRRMRSLFEIEERTAQGKSKSKSKGKKKKGGGGGAGGGGDGEKKKKKRRF